MPPDLVQHLRACAQNEILKKRTFDAINNDQWSKHYAQIAHNPSTQFRAFPLVPKFFPPVPKFEETTKKTKLNTEPLVSDSLSHSSAPLKMLLREGSSDHAFNINQSNSYEQAKTTITMQVASYDDSHSSPGSKNQNKLQEKIEVKEEHIEQIPQLILSNDQSTSEIISQTSISTVPSIKVSVLDKKDAKKLEKFLECLGEYLEKLNIKCEAVSEKFKELSIAIIPQLQTNFKSKPFEAVAAAILLYSCRLVDFPITIKQIISVSEVKEKLINKCIISLKESLPASIETKFFKAGEFINTLCEKISISDKVRAAALKIWGNIEKLNMMKSMHAVTLAACCLSYACCLSEDNRDLEAIAVAAGITKMTLKNMYRELFPFRHYFITVDCMLRDPSELKNF